eukprot:189921_1
MASRLQRILKHLTSNDNNASGLQSSNTLDENPTRYQEKIAFKMYLNPGQMDEYKRRHDLIPSEWPQLKQLLTDSGVRDYSIFFDEENNVLFACLWRRKDNTMDKLPDETIMQKWWKYMADLMKTHENNEPISTPLPCVFHMD